MLTLAEITKRAITWYIIAEHTAMLDPKKGAAGAYCTAGAYEAVLCLPYHKQCGSNCTENMRSYCKQKALDFINSDEICLNTFIENNTNIYDYRQ